jgi:hypothetical protein
MNLFHRREGMSQKVIKLCDVEKLADELFDESREVKGAARILKGILDCRSPRISDIAHAMEGNILPLYHLFLSHGKSGGYLKESGTQEEPWGG